MPQRVLKKFSIIDEGWPWEVFDETRNRPNTIGENEENLEKESDADEAIESVAKRVDFVSHRRMPHRGRMPESEVSKSKVAEELRKGKRVDFSGRKLTKGKEADKEEK